MIGAGVAHTFSEAAWSLEEQKPPRHGNGTAWLRPIHNPMVKQKWYYNDIAEK